MNPLRWPDFYQSESNKPKSFWENLPLIGWLFSRSDYEPIINNVKEQLLARPKLDPNVWGENLARQQMAAYVCKIVREEYEWPNDHFIPADLVEIVFQMPWDDLEIVAFMLLVEEDLELEISDKEAEEQSGTLGELVDFLVVKQAAKLARIH